jgi:hypothetical protein
MCGDEQERRLAGNPTNENCKYGSNTHKQTTHRDCSLQKQKVAVQIPITPVALPGAAWRG